MTPKPPDTSRDERILACLRRAPSGYLEPCSIAYTLHAPEATIVTALRRLELEGKVMSRSTRRQVDSRPVMEWAVR